MMNRLIINILFLIGSIVSQASAQKVTVSPEINIRADYSFHILGRVQENILIYRDQGNEKQVLLYDNDLVLQSERQVNLIEKRATVFELINLDTAFAIFYGFRQEDDQVIQMDVFSSTAVLIDSVEISRSEKSRSGLQFQSLISDDGSKIALYNLTSDEIMSLIVFDAKNREIILNRNYLLANSELYDGFVQAALSNDGHFFILTETDNFKGSKTSHTASIYNFLQSGDGVQEIIIPLKDILTSDIHLSLDNENRRMGLAGLYDDKKHNESSGYLWVEGSMDNWVDEDIHFNSFDEVIFFELYGNRNQKKLEDFSIANVLWKKNGAPIIILEMSLDVSRRSGGLTPTVNTRAYNEYNTTGGYAGWSDHYREDIVVISLNENFEKEWHQVFYKKQFSQNDQGIFSSMFSFVTPSRTRLIFNDEIKSNSTVSEYVFDGIGNFKRSSVLSTEYQNLRLRFQDALQISSTELLVPSQKNYILNLVKVDYSQ